MSDVTDLIAILDSLEKVSKRLRKVEVLSRSSIGLGGSFIALIDTPEAYAGYAGWNPVVNGLEDELEFQVLGESCITFICGEIGWRAIGGSPTAKTLIHETAFQLDTYGNDRGDYAIDLQQKSPDFPLVTHVAAGKWSVIFGGKKNSIDPDAFSCSIRGYSNSIEDWYPYVNIVGDFNRAYSGTVMDGGSNNTILGSGNWAQDAVYVLMVGVNNEIEKPLGGGGTGCFGAVIFGENNWVAATGWDNPTYCAQFGINNDLEGDIWDTYQFGELNYAFATGTNWWNNTSFVMQVGHQNYAEDVSFNTIFGTLCKSRNTASATSNFFDARMLLNGEEPNSYPSDGSGHIGGYNQASKFAQTEFIGIWTVAWITSRFEFPIIQESMWGFITYISGAEQFCANVYRWKIEGVIKNAGGVTTLVWSNVTKLFPAATTKEWQVIADNVNDRLVFQFRDTAGPDNTDCNIQFFMRTIEVGYD